MDRAVPPSRCEAAVLDWAIWVAGGVCALHGVLGLRGQENVALASSAYRVEPLPSGLVVGGGIAFARSPSLVGIHAGSAHVGSDGGGDVGVAAVLALSLALW